MANNEVNTEVKPGKYTTEFWLSVLASVLGVAVAAGVLSPDQASALSESATTIAGSLISVAGVLGYGVSRGLAKRK